MSVQTISILLVGLFLIVTGLWFITQWHENRDQEPTEQLFVYGTLQNPLIRFLTCRCITPSEPYAISGFHVVKRNLLPAEPEAIVHGQIIEVTPVELTRFDRYEQVPKRYVRVRASFIPREPWVYLRRETASSTQTQQEMRTH